MTTKGRAIVTGAAGFIGAALSARLSDLGLTVVGLDDARTGDWGRVLPSVERDVRDLAELTEADLRRLVRGADVLFHLAAEKYNSSVATPERILAVNVDATRRLFDAAAREDVGKTVFTSSLYAYGSLGPNHMDEEDVPRPTTVYGVSKLAGEHLLRVAARDHGLRWTAARLFFIYGPRQHATGGYKSVIVANFERLRQGLAPVVFGDGEQALDYVYIDDCVDALVAMAGAEHDGETFNVASGRPVSVNSLTRTMMEVAGGGLAPVTAPADWTAGSLRAGTTTRAQSRLGWQAKTSLASGLEHVWERQEP